MLSICLFRSVCGLLLAAHTLISVHGEHTPPLGAKAPFFQVQIDESAPRLRLYRNGVLIRTYAVALGNVDTQTPIGRWHIIDKQMDWGGGFGTRWLGLDVPWGIYGIHGTNRPESIGQYVSKGCIRLANPDVEELYDILPLGTVVVVKGNPFKHVRTLKHGDIGADVQAVQFHLQKAGYFTGVCDGKFDSGMQFSVMMFELAKGIPMDGVVGQDVYRLLGIQERYRKHEQNASGAQPNAGLDMAHVTASGSFLRGVPDVIFPMARTHSALSSKSALVEKNT